MSLIFGSYFSYLKKIINNYANEISMYFSNFNMPNDVINNYYNKKEIGKNFISCFNKLNNYCISSDI